MKNLAKLLPEGVSQETIEEIARLVDETIKQRVQEEKSLLTDKVFSFLNLAKDKIKEQALRELEADNSTIRNARIFENIKSLVAVELEDKDQLNAIQDIQAERDEIQEELAVVVGQLEGLLSENKKLQRNLKLAKNLSESLRREKEQLSEARIPVEETRYSDAGKVFSTADSDVKRELHEKLRKHLGISNDGVEGNRFITEDVEKLCS